MSPAGDAQLWDLIAARREGILATVRADGSPQLSNILYAVDKASGLVRISTTAGRAKTRHLQRNPRAAIHVAGDDFWTWAVGEGSVVLSDIAATAGDAACRELLEMHSAFYGSQEPEPFYAEMIANRRLVIRLKVERVYGLAAAGGRRPVATSSG